MQDDSLLDQLELDRGQYYYDSGAGQQDTKGPWEVRYHTPSRNGSRQEPGDTQIQTCVVCSPKSDIKFRLFHHASFDLTHLPPMLDWYPDNNVFPFCLLPIHPKPKLSAVGLPSRFGVHYVTEDDADYGMALASFIDWFEVAIDPYCPTRVASILTINRHPHPDGIAEDSPGRWDGRRIVVQDPFIVTENLAAGVDEAMFFKLKEEIRRAQRIAPPFGKTWDLNDLLDARRPI